MYQTASSVVGAEGVTRKLQFYTDPSTPLLDSVLKWTPPKHEYSK